MTSDMHATVIRIQLLNELDDAFGRALAENNNVHANKVARHYICAAKAINANPKIGWLFC